MSAAAKKIFEEALGLSDEEREALAEALRATLDQAPAALSPAWQREVKSRLAQLESGEVKAVPWTEAEARIRRTLGER